MVTIFYRISKNVRLSVAEPEPGTGAAGAATFRAAPEPEPESPGAASFCLEPEPEPTQVGRSRSLLRDLGHQEPEPEPPKKVAAPQQWFCPYFCHETLCCAKGHKRRLPSPDKKEIFLTRKPNAIFMSTLSKIIFYWEVWWESNMTSMKIFSFNI